MTTYEAEAGPQPKSGDLVIAASPDCPEGIIHAVFARRQIAIQTENKIVYIDCRRLIWSRSHRGWCCYSKQTLDTAANEAAISVGYEDLGIGGYMLLDDWPPSRDGIVTRVIHERASKARTVAYVLTTWEGPVSVLAADVYFCKDRHRWACTTGALTTSHRSREPVVE